MPHVPGLHAHYNSDFACAVIKAHVLGKEKFRFRNHTYETAKHIANVAEDLKAGLYKVSVSDVRKELPCVTIVKRRQISKAIEALSSMQEFARIHMKEDAYEA